MPKATDLYTVAGITTDAQGNAKVRWTTDLIRRTKLFYKQGYADVRLVDLPEPMDKLTALAFLQAHPDFQSAADRATMADAEAYRVKAAAKRDGTYVARPRGRPRKHPLGEVVVKATKRKAQPTLAAIASRAVQPAE